MYLYTCLLFLPAALGCLNPTSNKCASFIKSQSATASPFCATFTKSVVTATAGLPAWASNCSYKPSQISAECSCHYTGGAVTSTTVSKTTTAGSGMTTTTSKAVTTSAAGGTGIVTPTKVTTVFPSATGETKLASATVISGVFDGKMARWHRTCGSKNNADMRKLFADFL